MSNFFSFFFNFLNRWLSRVSSSLAATTRWWTALYEIFNSYSIL